MLTRNLPQLPLDSYNYLTYPPPSPVIEESTDLLSHNILNDNVSTFDDFSDSSIHDSIPAIKSIEIDSGSEVSLPALDSSSS